MTIQPTRCIIALMVALTVVVGCSGAPSQGGEEATPTPIPTPIVPTKPTYEVQRGEVVSMLEFTGRVSPATEEELFFRTPGYVGTVYVKRDDWVKAGDILAELEVTDLKNQLAQAEAALESAISNNEQQVTESRASLNAAELRLAAAQANDPGPQVTIAEVNVEWAQLALKDAQKVHNDAVARWWEKEEVREATARGVHNAELSLKVAEANYQQALQNLRAHEYDIQILQQEVDLARLRLEKLEAGLDIEEIRLTVERLKAQLSDARLTAPFDGQVLLVSVTEGRSVEAYRPVMVIGDPSELEVSADLTGTQMQDLVEGMAASCTLASRPGEEIKGHVRRLPYPFGSGGGTSASLEDQDESTRVALEITPEEAGLELGDLVHVTVVLERKEDVLWLPPQAIRTFEGRRFVVVQEGEGQRRVDVKMGIEGEDRVEIEEGATEGQIVIGQ